MHISNIDIFVFAADRNKTKTYEKLKKYPTYEPYVVANVYMWPEKLNIQKLNKNIS